MSNPEEIESLRASLKKAKGVQAELDRRVFDLKTLYDVSKDIYGSVETETILRNFLLMTMGNFGVMEGFLMLIDIPSKEISQFVSIGMQNSNEKSLKKNIRQLLLQGDLQSWIEKDATTRLFTRVSSNSLSFSL